MFGLKKPNPTRPKVQPGEQIAVSENAVRIVEIIHGQILYARSNWKAICDEAEAMQTTSDAIIAFGAAYQIDQEFFLGKKYG
jgi:hypothetical protein